MRLIRLATNNNAKFDANFDTPIELPPKGKLALQNLTLETVFNLLEINGTNNLLRVGVEDIANVAGNPGLIPQGTLVNTEDTREDFYHILTGALNETLTDFTPAEYTVPFYQGGGAEMICRPNPKSNRTEIMYAYTPSTSPFLRTSGNTLMAFNIDDIQFQPSIGGGVNIGDRFSIDPAGTTAQNSDYSYIAECETGLSFCRGGGTFSVQIESSTDNTVGGAFPITNNGVGIGLVIGKEVLPEPLTEAKVDFEIYYNRPAENYSIINGLAATRTDSGVAPSAVNTGTPQDHDIMGFTIEAGLIECFVSTPAGKTVVFQTELTSQQRKDIGKFGIQPFIYLNDNANFIKVCNARINFSPFIEKGFYTNENNFNRFAVDIPVVLNANLYDNVPYRYNPGATVNRFTTVDKEFKMEISNDILRFLGFVEGQLFSFSDTFIIKNGILTFHADREYASTFSDFFIVESQSLPLDSYNAVPDPRVEDNLPFDQTLQFPLKGDRKNILATIPINESTGEVVFETNTPIFIDIKNIGEQNIRNLKFRVVDKDFNEIQTSHTSNMTLLLEG